MRRGPRSRARTRPRRDRPRRQPPRRRRPRSITRPCSAPPGPSSGSSSWTTPKSCPPTRLYTLLLGADGSVALLADCNRGAGRFDLDGERLSFAPFATTKMACPEGSIDQAFLIQLGSTVSYGFAEGRLVLATAIDSSLLYFQPLP
jgi:hypothetical protein